MSETLVAPQGQPTEQEWRDLGSAEAGAWTITPPGGQPTSLDAYAQDRAQNAAQRQQHLDTMREEMDSEAAIRAAG